MLDRITRVTGMRTIDFAHLIAEEISWWRDQHDLDPEVVIEAVGIGVGIVEAPEDLGYSKIHGIHPGAQARDPSLYVNLRAEMWHEMNAGLKA